MWGAVCMHREVSQTSCGRHRGHRLRTELAKPTDMRVMRTKEIEMDIDTPKAILLRCSCSGLPLIRAFIHHPFRAWNVIIPERSIPSSSPFRVSGRVRMRSANLGKRRSARSWSRSKRTRNVKGRLLRAGGLFMYMRLRNSTIREISRAESKTRSMSDSSTLKVLQQTKATRRICLCFCRLASVDDLIAMSVSSRTFLP